MYIWRRLLSKVTQWYESAIIVDKNSKFQSRHVAIASKEEIPVILEQLKSIKSISKASHPHMIAWKIGSDSSSEVGFNDGGDRGAGARLLDLLIHYNLTDILLICTRWYGGKPLGGARFRHIKQSAVDSLKQANKI